MEKIFTTELSILPATAFVTGGVALAASKLNPAASAAVNRMPVTRLLQNPQQNFAYPIVGSMIINASVNRKANMPCTSRLQHCNHPSFRVISL